MSARSLKNRRGTRKAKVGNFEYAAQISNLRNTADTLFGMYVKEFGTRYIPRNHREVIFQKLLSVRNTEQGKKK